MRVVDILRLTAKETLRVEIVSTSSLRVLPLDEATKASIAEITRCKPGSTLVGIGPWTKLVGCGEGSTWNNWCVLTSPLPTEGDVPLLGPLDGQPSNGEHVRQRLGGESILVPLTDAQAEILKETFKGPILEKGEKHEH